MIFKVVQIVAVMIPIDPPCLWGHARAKLVHQGHLRFLVAQEYHRRGRPSLFDEREAVFRTADRAGLLVSGSLLAATEGLAPLANKDRRWLVPLTRFAVSRQFAAISSFVR